MESEKTTAPDLAALAAEALDLWQEHLALSASDPKAKAELMSLLEPSRRLFADWTTMMQKGAYGTHPASAQSDAPLRPSGAAPAGPSSDDGALRIAQLAHRVAELEKRLAKLESRGTGKAGKAVGPPSRGKPGV
ncbi:MAG: hypothetical protein M3N08_00310 [Pseudomonadota bacterium]|nr:hypothetical protein [Pseudomonadota bacterium]